MRYVVTNLNTLGWVLIILGVLQLTAGFSLGVFALCIYVVHGIVVFGEDQRTAA